MATGGGAKNPKRRTSSGTRSAKSQSRASSNKTRTRSKERTDTKSGTNGGDTPESPNLELAHTLFNFYLHAATRPTEFWAHSSQVWQEMIKSFAGISNITPAKGDRRFADPIWTTNPMYRALMQGFLGWRAELENWVDSLQLKGKDERRARFLLTTLADSLSPTNMLLGNPVAIQKTLDTGGKNLVSGFKNFVSDLQNNDGMPSQVDRSKFKVGENLALTPGQVVYRDPQLELLQYAPQTDKVYQRPIFIVPPQINKFYVWDLAPGRSVVEYLVQNGFQVFMVSWFNPDAEQGDWGLDTYVEALEHAAEVACEISGVDGLHMTGACSGGITTATLLSYLAAKNVDLARSLTLLVAVLDNEGTADTSLGLFANLETLELARAISSGKGVLEGRDLAKVFSWLRPNELIWSYWVNNYLLGNDPPAFDLLYWNNDTTRLTARLHSDFMTILQNNAFIEPGSIEINGYPIDLGQIECESYVVGGTTDHITPWQGCYRTLDLLGGKKEFVLSSSGHVQSIVNPPGGKRASYRLNTDGHRSPEEFEAGAKSFEGTWWEHWRKWLARRSGRKVNAPQALGNQDHVPLVDAPGTYILIEA